MTNATKIKLKELIAEGKVKDTLDQLKILTTNTNLHNDVLQLQSRQSVLKKAIQRNTISPANAGLESSKLITATLELIDELPEESTETSVTESTKKTILIQQIHHGNGDNVAGNKIVN